MISKFQILFFSGILFEGFEWKGDICYSLVENLTTHNATSHWNQTPVIAICKPLEKKTFHNVIYSVMQNRVFWYIFRVVCPKKFKSWTL